MLDLSNAKQLGRGNERICYLHPTDPKLCIKVNKAGEVRRNQNRQESLYFKHLQSRGVPFEHLPEYGGWAETTQGPGVVYERICNEDGSPSHDLQHHLSEGRVTEGEAKQLLETLHDFLMKYSIAISDLNPDQLLLKRGPDGDRLVIIDGVGARRPGFKAWLMRHVHVYARRKTQKNWRRVQAAYGVV